MSLLGWLGSTQKVNERSLSPVKTGKILTKRIVLGVLGSRSNIRYEDVITNLLTPMLETWGTPDEILLPANGDSSFVIQSWAELKGIPVTLVTCDWVRNGKRAGIFRDTKIQRESSHLLLLQGPRSNALSGLAARLRRKGVPIALSERPGLVADLGLEPKISVDK